MATDGQLREIYHLISDYDDRRWLGEEVINFYTQFFAEDGYYDLVQVASELLRYAEIDFVLREDANNAFGFHGNQLGFEYRYGSPEFRRAVDGSDVPDILAPTTAQLVEVKYLVGESFYDGVLTPEIVGQHLVFVDVDGEYDLSILTRQLLRLLGRYHMANRPEEWGKCMRRAELLTQTLREGTYIRRTDGSDTPVYVGV